MAMNREPEIYCPKCRWRPKPESRWACMPRCNYEWNTFWTGGLCPKCSHRWLKTQCLSCHEVSLHRDWYHDPAGGDQGVREKRELPAKLGA